MLSVDQALDTVLSHSFGLGTQKVGYAEALGHILAEDVVAKDALPPFPASIKDGYAVVASDGAGPRPVAGDSTAGSGSGQHSVTAGLCVRINTGAPVPAGADAVVQVSGKETHT